MQRKRNCYHSAGARERFLKITEVTPVALLNQTLMLFGLATSPTCTNPGLLVQAYKVRDTHCLHDFHEGLYIYHDSVWHIAEVYIPPKKMTAHPHPWTMNVTYSHLAKAEPENKWIAQVKLPRHPWGAAKHLTRALKVFLSREETK